MSGCNRSVATIVLLITMTLLWGIPVSVLAGETKVTAGLSLSTGDYGTSANTDIQSISFSVRHRAGPWTFKAGIPWLRITGAANVLPNGDTTSSPTARRTRRGLGDLTVSLGRQLFQERQLGMSLRGKVKFPTADADKGLGTGKADFTLEVAPWFRAGRVTLFGTLGFKKYGDTGTTDYHDVWLARAGFLYPVTREQRVGVSAYYRQNTLSGRDDRRSITLFHILDGAPGWQLQSYLVKGFSDATADLAGGISLSRQY